ncbi:flagellar motor protein [Legionella pneumophila]|uniref:Chemotaxis protein MotA n=1 Tax=Legionella pneumophila subsp. pascullei TaxID=91890 RepID=A0AAX2IXN6_LEGPN|nr:flagellar motor protein [Legionella pneumophila]AMP89575.1 flagellar motor protein [Legionella pneumophila subsp. pascullei]AMP92759.1 flagellar motor protein [Legionella pneumophila subsp. pascullei]AMP95725.1 flagellar motor protein [Legionella pneumophila subsp. pascullei]SQG90637.1 chemotaxis protein MotA [Legionella pneumophila subsp. pascullei]VEH07182.1 chemotaxis protein MotA [Legionella pneumophila subsp. pascullei]
MDALTLIGLLTGFLAIIVGQMFEGGDLNSLLNFPALLIVMGGTLGAVMVQTPLATFKRAFRILPWVVKPPHHNFEECRATLIELSRKARQLGLLSLEDRLDVETNPLIYKGLELLVTGVDKLTIRQVLESEIDRTEHQDLRAAYVFESMGGYSPTIGILGAVLGLIQVMRNLADPSQLGLGIAVAFVATIYGVGLANLIFLPVANKLKSCISHRVHFDEMVVEGLVAMASGESPNMLQLKLNNYGQHKQDEIKAQER